MKAELIDYMGDDIIEPLYPVSWAALTGESE